MKAFFIFSHGIQHPMTRCCKIYVTLPISSSRSAHLGGTVATIGFPDPSLQGFSPKLAKGEIASLSGAGDDPRYFQISVVFADGHHAAGQMAGRASSAGG